MATDKAIESARQQLRMKIFRLLESASFDRPGKLAQAVHPIFAEVLDALEDLDDGEVPLAFRPSTPAHKGVKPAEIAKLRMRAVSYISALKKRGMDLPDAIAAIAGAFNLGEEAVAKWRLAELKKVREGDGTPRRKVELADLVGIDNFQRTMGHGFSVEQIIEKANRDGKRLAVLQPNYTKGSKK